MRYCFGLLFLILNVSLAFAHEPKPLQCFLLNQHLLIKHTDIVGLDAGLDQPVGMAVLIVETIEDVTAEALSFTESLVGQYIATEILGVLIQQQVRVSEPTGMKRFAVGVPDLTMALLYVDKWQTGRGEDKAYMSVFGYDERMTLHVDDVMDMSIERGQPKGSIVLNKTSAERLRKVGHGKTDWRCFVGGREASGWELDENQSPPVFHFKLK